MNGDGELELGPVVSGNSDSGASFDLAEQHPELRNRVLRIARKRKSVSAVAGIEVSAAGFRC